MIRILLALIALIVAAHPAAAQNSVRKTDAPLIVQALQSLRPGAEWSLTGSALTGLQWKDAVQTRPTDVQINAEIARINTLPSGSLSVAVFIGRWTNTEYSNLMKARATAITGNTAGMTLVKQWDQAVVIGTVDMTTQVAKDFKAALVSAGILTQARADVIFQ